MDTQIHFPYKSNTLSMSSDIDYWKGAILLLLIVIIIIIIVIITLIIVVIFVHCPHIKKGNKTQIWYFGKSVNIPGNIFSNFPLACLLSLFFVSATPQPHQIYYLIPQARRQLLSVLLR